MPTESKALNINTIFLAVLIALSGWTVNRVADLSVAMGASDVSKSNLDREIVDLRLRVTAIEVALQANQIAIAKMRP